MNKKCYNTFLMCTHTPVCGVQKKKKKKNQLSIAAQFKSIATGVGGRGEPPHPAVSLSFNLFQSICAGQ